jgi:hypothetical protein
MTNEPPTGDGEELVEDDLPGWSEREEDTVEGDPEHSVIPELGPPDDEPITVELEAKPEDDASLPSQTPDLDRPVEDFAADASYFFNLSNTGEVGTPDDEAITVELEAEPEDDASWPSQTLDLDRPVEDFEYPPADPGDFFNLDETGGAGTSDDEPISEVFVNPLYRQRTATPEPDPAVTTDESRSVEYGTPYLDRLTDEFERSLEAQPPNAETSTPNSSRLPRLLVPASLVAAVLIAIILGIVTFGGSEEGDQTATSTGERPASTPAPADAAATSAPAAAPVTSDPPEGYTFCQVHPDEGAAFCRPYYSSTGTKSTLFPASPRRVLEHTITFGAPIPTDPQLPLEYKLVVSGAAGPTIEQVFSGGPGEPLTCVRFVSGAPTADGPEDVCGQITAPDTIYMQADLSAYGEGPIKAEWFAQEIEADGTLRGDYKDLLGDSGVLMR